jgi:hypothetical protein
MLTGTVAVLAVLSWFGWQLARTVGEDRAVERGVAETPHQAH